MKRLRLSNTIRIYDLETDKYFDEKVFGEWFLKWLYQSRSGSLLGFLFTKLPFSMMYGALKSSVSSKAQIQDFIQTYEIEMDEFKSDSEYKCFNDFFIREFKSGVRSFDLSLDSFPAFCEGRYLVYNSSQKTNIKNTIIDPFELISPTDGADFISGQVIVARLAPVDYHRYHYPDDGVIERQYDVDGLLNSVTPYALASKPDVLVTNKRRITILKTEEFGRIAYIEVGALTVGTIKQTHHDTQFKRGQEKGYFLFGGSTVVILTEKKVIDFDSKILENSKKGIESFVKLGRPLGKKRNL